MDIRHPYDPPEMPEPEEKISVRRYRLRQFYATAGGAWFCTWGIGQFIGGGDRIAELLQIASSGAIFVKLYVIFVGALGAYFAYDSHPKAFSSIALLGSAQVVVVAWFGNGRWDFALGLGVLSILIALSVYFEERS